MNIFHITELKDKDRNSGRWELICSLTNFQQKQGVVFTTYLRLGLDMLRDVQETVSLCAILLLS